MAVKVMLQFPPCGAKPCLVHVFFGHIAEPSKRQVWRENLKYRTLTTALKASVNGSKATGSKTNNGKAKPAGKSQSDQQPHSPAPEITSNKFSHFSYIFITYTLSFDWI